ncbi:uncharacterized protein isoform X2 [Rhodnius prolixus]|uniref:uncharacterized protein isoform X2 n=1 Tax=Rhodnius prolixus TaxID=13249 RepID=UPI003D1898A2
MLTQSKSIISNLCLIGVDTQPSKYHEPIENLGTSSKENMIRYGMTEVTTNGSEKVKKKYRRSMLGQRTKLYNLDSVLNITKHVPSFTEEQGKISGGLTTENEQTYHYLSSETPDEKYMKPLHSSSPHSGSREQKKSALETSKMDNLESITPPNPFGCDISPTKFFEKGIDEISTWSVFKTKLDGLKSPLATNEEIVQRSAPQISKTSVRKNFKMKLFDNMGHEIPNGRRHDEDVIGTDSSKETEINKVSKLDWSCHKQCNSKESARQPKIQYSKACDQYIGLDIENDFSENNSNRNCIQKNENFISNDCDYGNNTAEAEHAVSNSDDDNDSFNSTIVAAVQKSASKTPKLSVICEEEDNQENYNFNETSLINSASSEHSSDVKETLSQENFNIKLELDHLNELCGTVQKHSNNIDKLFAKLYQEKVHYNTYFNKLQDSITSFQAKYKTYSLGNSTEKSININSNGVNKQRKKKRVRSCKLKQSPALMLTPENTFASPFSSNKLSKKKKGSFLNNYTELRKSFTYLQTPEHKSAKKTHFNNSVIYTPKSLSVCISEQMKRLDS